MSLIEIQKLYNLNLDNYFKFCIVRNPFDRIVSLYFNFLCNRQGGTEILRYSKFRRFYKSIFWKSNKDFNLFCQLLYESEFWKKEVHFRPQYEYLLNKNGQLSIDFIGRFENLENDFYRISKILDINTKLIHINQSKRLKDYRKYFNKESIEIIKKLYKIDIETFGYSF
tara:strand:- start:183 stop:689 length:507 start_codon:yes stop_codon:yes gene_type:complete